MIDYFVGTVQELRQQEVLLNLGFVGVAVQIPRTHAFIQGEQVKIYTYLHWNAENGPSLYGFSSPVERSVFCVVISCSGIGPKIALAILSDIGAEGFLQSIQMADEQALSKVSGIGKKKAEQMIVALKHKVNALLESGTVTLEVDPCVMHMQDVSQALQSLNYSRGEINHAIDYIRKNVKTPDVTFDYLLRQALVYLSKQV